MVRKHRYLLETARDLLFQSGLPLRFWGDCILAATYLINKFSSSVLKDKSPYEILYNKLPTYSNLRSFGCLCYSTVPNTHRDKLQPSAIPCVFIDYPFGKKDYKLYDLQNKVFFVSRDVIFHEHVFAFVQSGSTSPTMSHLPFSACFDHSVKKNSSLFHDFFYPAP